MPAARSAAISLLVDPEFKSLIPPLTSEERIQLESNLLRDGCLDALKVWVCEGERIIVDGHNRYELCCENDIEFDLLEMPFESREAAKDWILCNQAGRRNLTQDQLRLVRGELYNLRKKPHGGDKKSKAQDGPLIDNETTAEQVAKEFGVSKNTIKRDAKFAEEVAKTPELKKAVDERKPTLQVKRELKEKKRESRREENRKKIAAVPDAKAVVEKSQAKFATIVIDPPWDWGDEGDVDQMGRARPDYATMSIEQLKALPVGTLSDDDCHIYLWITNRSLPKGFHLLEAWGFRYITALTWVKPAYGMGNYFRGQTEHVLFGVKGSQPLKRKDVGTVFHEPRGKGGHSSKPSAFLTLVESCSPGPYIEMFSRSERKGWVSWGESTVGA